MEVGRHAVAHEEARWLVIPRNSPASVLDGLDEEAIVDEEPPEQPLADATGLGVDLPEADVLDQWREVELDDEER